MTVSTDGFISKARAEVKRQNTTLEVEGAEFPVLPMLLIEGIQCYKAYTNFAGYNLVAFDPARGRSARIQVKMRGHERARDASAIIAAAAPGAGRAASRRRSSARPGA